MFYYKITIANSEIQSCREIDGHFSYDLEYFYEQENDHSIFVIKADTDEEALDRARGLSGELSRSRQAQEKIAG